MFFSSLEVVVRLLVAVSVGHLFHPGFAQVGLRRQFFVAALLILCMLNHHRVFEAFSVHECLVVAPGLRVVSLILQLVLERGVLPLSLVSVVLAHLVNHLLGLLGPEVGLVVLLVVVAVVSALLFRPVHLHLDEVLVLSHRLVALRVLLSHLVLLLLDVVDELGLLSLAQFLQTNEFVFITVKRSQVRLVNNGRFQV